MTEKNDESIDNAVVDVSKQNKQKTKKKKKKKAGF